MKKIFIALTSLGMFSQVWFAEATPPKPRSAHNFRTANFHELSELIFAPRIHNPLQPAPIKPRDVQGALVALSALGSTKVLEKCGMPSEISPLATLVLAVVGYSLCPNKKWGKDINQAIFILSGYVTLKNSIHYFWKNKPQEKPSQEQA